MCQSTSEPAVWILWSASRRNSSFLCGFKQMNVTHFRFIIQQKNKKISSYVTKAQSRDQNDNFIQTLCCSTPGSYQTSSHCGQHGFLKTSYPKGKLSPLKKPWRRSMSAERAGAAVSVIAAQVPWESPASDLVFKHTSTHLLQSTGRPEVRVSHRLALLQGGHFGVLRRWNLGGSS